MIREACTTDVRQMARDEQTQLGTRVLVMRRWPRGLSRHDVDVWLPDAGPSLDLLQRYRAKEIDWSQFEQEYRREQCEQKTCRVVWYSDGERTSDETVAFSPLKTLSKWSLARNIAVMCWENHEQCHRYIILDMLGEGPVHA
jgi:uncharacterized protein YeaO (DUF488 family)